MVITLRAIGMNGRTYSLRGLLIAVTVAALALAVWLSSNAWLASAVFSLALLLPALAVVAALASQRERRCRWLACAILSGGYFWAILTPKAQPMMPTAWMIQQEGPLLTSKINEWLYMNVFIKLRPPPPLPAGTGIMGGRGVVIRGGAPVVDPFITTGPPGSVSVAPAPPSSYYLYPSLEDFARIGHAYFALLLGWAGYALARFLMRR